MCIYVNLHEPYMSSNFNHFERDVLKQDIKSCMHLILSRSFIFALFSFSVRHPYMTTHVIALVSPRTIRNNNIVPCIIDLYAP